GGGLGGGEVKGSVSWARSPPVLANTFAQAAAARAVVGWLSRGTRSAPRAHNPLPVALGSGSVRVPDWVSQAPARSKSTGPPLPRISPNWCVAEAPSCSAETPAARRERRVRPAR